LDDLFRVMGNLERCEVVRRDLPFVHDGIA
jgi:hypothetical protein